MLDRFTCHSRSIRIQTQQPTGQVHQLAPRPICDSDKCLPVEKLGMHFPCLQIPAEDTPGGVYSGSGKPCVGHTTLVPNLTGPAGRIPTTTPSTQEATLRPIQQSSPPSGVQPTPISRLESLRKCHTAVNFSERASELVVSGWSKGTNTAYQSGWNK